MYILVCCMYLSVCVCVCVLTGKIENHMHDILMMLVSCIGHCLIDKVLIRFV